MCIFQDLHGANIDVQSAGLQPMIGAGMDKRSNEWLKSKGYEVLSHQPKKISIEILKRSDLILALDHIILMNLNKMFPSMQNKIKLLSYQYQGDINLSDPYRLENHKYDKVLDNIEDVIKDFSVINI